MAYVPTPSNLTTSSTQTANANTASPPLPNLYHRRLVAATNQKPCYICHKPSATVLITPDFRDFFYVCAGHLKDSGFATPQDVAPSQSGENSNSADSDEQKKKARDDELQKEIDKVVKEYQDRVKRRKERKKQKKKKEVKDDDDDFSSDGEGEAEAKDTKVKELEAQKSSPGATGEGTRGKEGGPPAEEGPRVFILNRAVFDMRMRRIKEAQMAKRRQESMKSGTFWPTVPTGELRRSGGG
ncbi:MAG: hypothetical protein Q9162_001704 [Coniocarpon cinnabarinum]